MSLPIGRKGPPPAARPPAPPCPPRYSGGRAARIADTVMGSHRLVAGDKMFEVSFRENSRGRCLRVTESANARHNTVIIPESALPEFLAAIGNVVSGA